MYSSTLSVMRQRAMTLSIYTITDNTVTLHQSERHQHHTHTYTHTTQAQSSGGLIHCIMSSILPYPPLSQRKENLYKGKLKRCGLNTMLISPSSCIICFPSLFYFNFTFLLFSPLFYFAIFSSSIYLLLQPQPARIDEQRLLVTLRSVCTHTPA